MSGNSRNQQDCEQAIARPSHMSGDSSFHQDCAQAVAGPGVYHDPNVLAKSSRLAPACFMAGTRQQILLLQPKYDGTGFGKAAHAEQDPDGCEGYGCCVQLLICISLRGRIVLPDMVTWRCTQR